MGPTTCAFRRPAAELESLIRDARRRTLALTRDLPDAALRVPMLEVVNPPLWELGHVGFFYEAFVLRELGWLAGELVERGRERYDSAHVEHDERWVLDLPDRAATLDYLARVEERVAGGLAAREPDERTTYVVLLAALHEDMHGEALTYTRQTLAYPAPVALEGPSGCSEGGPCPGDVAVPGGSLLLGSPADAPRFVFDNEKPAREVEVAPFEIARAPVTEAGYLEFVEAGGYGQRDLWSEEGWAWRAALDLDHPATWRRAGGSWHRRHFDREEPLREHAPVCHVSWHEAQAWCRWAGRRLPSEAEWELAAGGGRAGPGRATPWGAVHADAWHAHLDACETGCVDVGAFARGDSPFGCRQMLGNVWEWTASRFEPYDGFTPDDPYGEYSAPWFGSRRVLRGGSWATRARLASTSYRNFFPPGRNDIFAGFRTCPR